MLLGGPKYSTKRFTYNAETRTFSAEVSELLNGGSDFIGPLYDDACDYGFTLVSHKTHQEVVYCLSGKKEDAEGDVEYWEFIEATVTDGIRTYRPNFGTLVKVFND